jgi:hypothetical protein
MKNYIQLFVSALIISIFWSVIYVFAGQILAAYLAIVFGIISTAVFCWIALKVIIGINVRTNNKALKAEKRKFVQKQMYDTISETA